MSSLNECFGLSSVLKLSRRRRNPMFDLGICVASMFWLFCVCAVFGLQWEGLWHLCRLDWVVVAVLGGVAEVDVVYSHRQELKRRYLLKQGSRLNLEGL